MATVATHGTAYKITGLRETVRQLERLGVESQDLKQAFGRVSATVVRKAKAKAPVGPTGRLGASVRPSKSKNKAVVRAGFAARAPHAGPINYGWPSRNIRPTHFLTDAANEDTAQHVATIEAELSRLIRSLDL